MEKKKVIGRPIPPIQTKPTKESIKYQIKNSFICSLIVDRLPAIFAIAIGMYESLVAKHELYRALFVTFLSYGIFTIVIISLTFFIIFIDQTIKINQKWEKYEKMVGIYKKYNPIEASQYHFPSYEDGFSNEVGQAVNSKETQDPTTAK